jgi:alpha-1,3-fucosyltransferase
MESENNFKRQFSATVAKFEKNGYTGDINKNYSQIFREKTESLLWMVSHCQTQSKRESYIEELAKFTNVTNIGRCNENKSSSCPNKLNCEIDLAKKFKFYLAFENSLCIDYITEKAFKWYSRDIIIAVRGARDYQKFLPKGTFIDTNDFTSPKSLARYLNKLGSDEQRYTNILKLKDHLKVIGEQEHAQIAYCNLCFKLNNLRQFKKSIKNVGDWWTKNACVKSNDILVT